MTTKHQYGTRELAKDFGELTFGNALLSFRLGENKNQQEFAKRLGISPQSLCDIEKGRKIPSPKRASKIAKILSEPIAFWVQLALQDLVKKEKLNLSVSVEPDLEFSSMIS